MPNDFYIINSQEAWNEASTHAHAHGGVLLVWTTASVLPDGTIVETNKAQDSQTTSLGFVGVGEILVFKVYPLCCGDSQEYVSYLDSGIEQTLTSVGFMQIAPNLYAFSLTLSTTTLFSDVVQEVVNSLRDAGHFATVICKENSII